MPAPHLAEPSRVPSPFVKWAGGKGRLLTQLMPLLPPGAAQMRHVEPFIGGGAMFFARRPNQALLCDVNPTLVLAYRMVRDEVDKVIALLELHASSHNKAYYYAVRERYNRNPGDDGPERAAMFIYLNKTCFNGLHRVNKKGEFNVPAGRYTNPRIVDADGLRAASLELAKADLYSEDFGTLVRKVRPGDFVYLDPPYEPVSRTASFTSYAAGGFSRDDQERLRDVFAQLDHSGCRCMLSNSDTPFIRDLYREFRIDTVAAPRAVNCDAKGRGLVSEVVVRNY